MGRRGWEGSYYDRDGLPISFVEWTRLRGQGEAYARIARTDVGQGVDVSTVWIGIDYNFADDGSAPLVCETMVFGAERFQHAWRWPNADAALAGHDQVVALVRGLMHVE